MIPTAYIQEWASKAPWPNPQQVEQDLIICRALCDLFSSSALVDRIAFRGGTAIHKLLFTEPLRYSEDIDLVQTRPEPIGATANAIRNALSWMGKCKHEQAAHSICFTYRYTPEDQPGSSLKLKVELNTREHDHLYGIQPYSFQIASSWHRAETTIHSFTPEELFATKLRALLQRRKNRDLFDLHRGLQQLNLDADKLLTAFQHYLVLEGKPITRAIAEQRMLEKLTRSLTEDIAPLLPVTVRFDEADAIAAFETVWNKLISKLPGETWKLTETVIEELRKKKYPGLLRNG